MDLIEVLWKQDVDLGFSLEQPPASAVKEPPEKESLIEATSSHTGDDDIEKLKALKALNDEIANVRSKAPSQNIEHIDCKFLFRSIGTVEMEEAWTIGTR